MSKQCIIVEGMTCTNCAANVKKKLVNEGVADVHVDFISGEVRFDPGEIKLQQIAQFISSIGYSTSGKVEQKQQTTDKKWSKTKRYLVLASIFTLPLILMHFFMIGGSDALAFIEEDPFVQLVICLPVYVIGVLYFGKSSYRAIKNRVIHMDLLIFIGSTAAMIYSLIGTFGDNPIYIFYETAATIITLVLLGNYIEERAIKRTSKSIEGLSKYKVDLVNKFRKDVNGNETIVSTKLSDILPGDKLQINSGERIPVDGVIIEGKGEIDESIVNGEPLPVVKNIDSKLISGSLLLNGNLKIKCLKDADSSFLSQMIALVKKARSEPPKIQRLADKISAIFVPAVLIFAALTFLINFFGFNVSAQESIMRAIAVLVISCPCAMGLATPTAIVVGLGRSSKNGILFKSAQSMETFAQTEHVIFDKTGTLTKGVISIESIKYNSDNTEQINSILVQMEQRSNHPIGKAIIRHLANSPSTKDVELTNIVEIAGEGISAEDEKGAKYFLGAHFNSIALKKENQILALIELKDAIKDDAKNTVKYLNETGVTTSLLSGDSSERVKNTSEYLGISNYTAGASPQEKFSTIERLKNSGVTTMVGDGINDAPALAMADIGVSFGNATDIAVNSSDVILLDEKISAFDKALTISRLTLKTIKENLFWAFSYNIIAIPMAALGFLHPMWAALFMAFSDVIIFANSLRLRWRK